MPLYSLTHHDLDSTVGVVLERQVVRELKEETGATGIVIGRYLGYDDECRPHRRDGYDLLFMRSHFYLCHVDRLLGDASPEPYEAANGMVPRWVKVDEAIAHNESLLRDKPASMGMSIHRETLMLRYVAGNCLHSAAPLERST